MAPDQVIELDLGDRSYDILLQQGRLDGLGQAVAGCCRVGRAAVITDGRVAGLVADEVEAELRGAGFETGRFVFDEGEHNKHLGTWQRMQTELLEWGVDRQTCVVAVGGGVVGDVAGFVAATCLRGLPLVQVPTTLLAMVDSSVGGKTGVNHGAGKNLVGAFHQPRLVFIGLGTLSTLDPRQRASGLGEVVKTALIDGESMLAAIEADAERLGAGDPDALLPVVAACVRTKARVVAADELEAGARMVLNAGHTVGHGVEAAAGFGRLLHGEAVALGLVAEARWAVAQGLCEARALPERLLALFGRLGLPMNAPEVAAERVVERMLLDKKVDGDMLWLPVPTRVGQFQRVRITRTQLRELVSYLP